jgi:hypothetical protein
VRFIPTIAHGVADYFVGLIVISLPFMLGIGGTPRQILIALGVIVVLYSLVTDYELGAFRYLRIRFHLLLDAAFGIVMLFLPMLLDMPDIAHWPFYVLGALALVLTVTTKIRAEGTAAS